MSEILYKNDQNYNWEDDKSDDSKIQTPSISPYTPEKINKYYENDGVSSFVRTEYLNYIEKLLRENYNTWCTVKTSESCLTSKEVRKCAEKMELRAAKSCMMIQLYRKSILRMFAEIRKETQNSVLNPKLKEFTVVNIKKLTADACVQTDIEQINHLNSLDERVRLFELRLKEEEYQRKKFKLYLEKEKLRKNIEYNNKTEPLQVKRIKLNDEHNNNIPVTTKLEPLKSNEEMEDDQIVKELEKLFGIDMNVQNDIDDIFGEGNRSSQILNIEFEKKNNNCEIIKQIIEPKIQKFPIVNIEEDRKIFNKNKLNDSIWPYELHIQRFRYQEYMLKLADMGYRHSVKIKEKMIELFGEDSDDEEIALYSPNLELDEILLSSIKKRIAPWIVKSLMKPKNEGRIANKILFKQVAKRITDKIIINNKYPTEIYVSEFVENYFGTNLTINYVEDIT